MASFQQTLWTDCFFEAVDNAEARGEDFVSFEDVDKLVIERSKSIRSGSYKFDPGLKEDNERISAQTIKRNN